ncbi:MAG: invasion protein [Rhodobacter sp. CACIA14H1]|nr:MAG: invasion protein [Rhodobacter sp. CACIA14H1]
MIRAALLSLLLLATPAAAQDCARLAAAAGAEAGLPDGLLPAISLVEAGRGDGKGGVAPWPWTLNEGGKGMYFDTREAALAYLEEALARGVTNIDIGCMQLNWKWHSAGFASPADMIDPERNTRYAARFMVELQARLGSWETASAAYHSTDPERGQRYLQKVLAAQGSFRLAPEGDGLRVAGLPANLRGILAFAGEPLVALASSPPADGFSGETPFDGIPVEAATPDPDAPRPPPRPDGPAHRGPPPDLPMVIAAATATLALRADLPPRLRHRWAEVEAMRTILAETP